MLTDRVRVPTPVGAPPQQIVKVLADMVAPLGAFDRVSVGFPGVVRDGRVLTAPNLGNDQWQGYDARPVRSVRRSASRCGSPTTPTCRDWP